MMHLTYISGFWFLWLKIGYCDFHGRNEDQRSPNQKMNLNTLNTHILCIYQSGILPFVVILKFPPQNHRKYLHALI